MHACSAASAPAGAEVSAGNMAAASGATTDVSQGSPPPTQPFDEGRGSRRASSEGRDSFTKVGKKLDNLSPREDEDLNMI